MNDSATLFAVVVVILAAGCKNGPASSQPEEPVAQVVGESAGRPDGPVTVTGEAGNAKLGAVVVVDGSPIYLTGMDAWPEDVVGKSVTVTGTSRTTDAFEAHQDDNGAWSQGTAGPVTFIDDPGWKLDHTTGTHP